MTGTEYVTIPRRTLYRSLVYAWLAGLTAGILGTVTLGAIILPHVLG